MTLDEALRTFNRHYPYHKDLGFIYDNASPSGGRIRTWVGAGDWDITHHRAFRLERLGLIIIVHDDRFRDGDRHVELTTKGRASLAQSEQAFNLL